MVSRRIESVPHVPPAVAVGLLALVVLVSGCSGEPYAYTQVSGRVTYEDGTVIPAPKVKVAFISQTPPADPKTHPLPGVAEVDPKTGDFKVVTSHTYNDGVVPGEHKVLVEAIAENDARLPLVPPEYADVNKTPLHVNTKDSPFTIKVPKPQAR